MKLKLKPSLLALAATCTLGFMTSAISADLDAIKKSDTIRIAVANEIPYGYMDVDGKAKGAGPEVAQKIVEALGIKNIEWTTTNFGSLIPGLQADRYDMVAAEMAILPQRCKQIIYSEPNSSYGEGLLVPAGNPKDIHSFESFADSGNKIAIMAGADHLEFLQAMNVPEDKMVVIANNADAISTVSSGRADAYAATSLTVVGLASKGKGKVEAAADFIDPVIDGEVIRSWGGFAFSKDSPNLRDAVNAELAKFKKTDEWSNILADNTFSAEDASESFARSTAELCAE